MALGNKNNNDNSKLLILKIRTQDLDKKAIDPIFQVNEKVDGKWVSTDTTTAVEGQLTRAEVKEGEYEGQKTYNISLYLKDTEAAETYLVDLKLNMLTRGLLNSVLNLTKFDEVKFGLYTGKNGYPNVAVRQHGEMVKWKYSLDEMPTPDEVMFKGKKMRDYSAVDEFFIEKIKELAARVNGAAPAKSKDKTVNTTKVVKSEAKAESPADSDMFDDKESDSTDDDSLL